jgi:hypothetical protein
MTSELHSTYVEFLSGATTQVRATASADTLTFAGDGANVELQGVADPTVAQAVATKAYVDAGGGGLLKTSARVATTVAGTMATSFANGQTVDGVALATGDRILIKNQATTDNGVYTVQGAGAPVRTSDFSAAAAVNSSALFIVSGNVNESTTWSVTNAVGSDVVGTDVLVFASVAPVGVATNYGEINFQAPGAQYVNVSDQLWRTPNSTWSSGLLDNFSFTGGNTLTYTGTNTRIFNCNAQLSMTSDNFGGVPLDLGIFKYDFLAATDTLQLFQLFTAYDTGAGDHATCVKLLSLSTNDRVDIRWRRAQTGGNPDFFTDTGSLVITLV